MSVVFAAVICIGSLCAATQVARAQKAINTSEQPVRLIGSHPEASRALADGPEIAPSRMLMMTISLRPRNSAELDKLLREQQDPSSPEFHRWLLPGEFDARFGASREQKATVGRWLARNGFTLSPESPDSGTIAFSGSAVRAESVFKVEIHTSPNGRRYTNLSDPALPASIAALVASIRGLSNLRRAYPEIRYGIDRGVTPDATINHQTGFGPNDIYTFYDQTPPTSKSVDGTGADCIAVIEDSNFDDASVNAFDAQFGLEAVNVSRQFPDGTDPGINADESETLLDVEYAHAAAPGVAIYPYIGDDQSSRSGDGVLDATAQAVRDDTCGAIDISFGYCGGSRSFYSHTFGNLFKRAAAQGQAVFVASGDSGSAGVVFDPLTGSCAAATSPHVSELAAGPHVTAVGGTEFTPNYNSSGVDLGSVAESVWDDFIGAGGGGSSRIFARPAFQKKIAHLGGRRAVPDVAFAASPSLPGFFFGIDGSVSCCVGGTSLGTPYWAGIAQLAAQREGVGRVGNLNASLYVLARGGTNGIRDVTIGTNAFNGVRGFGATTGYDRASGLGAPDIDNLLKAIAGH